MIDRSLKIRPLPPASGREIAISDIHGNLEGYKALLAKVGYQPGVDRLVLVGDLVERGPQSLPTLRYIMQQFENGEDIWAVMGNHDFSAKNILFNYRPDFIKKVLLRKRSLIHEMAAEAGLPPLTMETDMSEWSQQIRKHYLKELAFLSDLPHILEGERIYVHAGLLSESFYGHETRDVLTYPFFLETEETFSRPVVVGHMPVSEYYRRNPSLNPIFDAKKNIWAIDGGNEVKDFGQLNALIFEKDSAETAWVDQCPKVHAIHDAAAHNTLPFYLTWGRGQVEILEEEGDQAHVHSPYLHRTFWIHKDRLIRQGDIWLASNYCSTQLPLETGDEVSFIARYSDKVDVKKNGFLGWVYAADLDPEELAAAEKAASAST